MGRKKHTSARGVSVNWDELLLKNKNVVAVGNVPMNAIGDRLGPGGKVVHKAGQAKYNLPPSDAAYNQNNPKAVKLVSLKDDLSKVTSSSKKIEDKYGKDAIRGEGAKTPQEVMKNLRSRSRQEKPETTSSKQEEESNKESEETKSTSQSKRKIVDSEE